MLQVRSDKEILQDIRDTLAWDVRIDDANVVVDVTDGIAAVSGTVRTFSEKTVAVEDAWKIKGVKSVVDKLTVSPEGLRFDADIANDIYNTLRSDNRLDAANIVVKVAGGNVELSGTVRTLAEKESAEEDVWFTNGEFAGECGCAEGFSLVDPTSALLNTQDEDSSASPGKASGS